MILDRIEELKSYCPMHRDLEAVLAHLATVRIADVEAGRHPVPGTGAFFMVQRYASRPLAASVWESHQQYIDVQYMVEGTELMGWAPIDTLEVVQPYDSEKDAALYQGTGRFIEVSPGMAAVFFPQDAHMPGVVAGKTAQVLKVVVKLPVL